MATIELFLSRQRTYYLSRYTTMIRFFMNLETSALLSMLISMLAMAGAVAFAIWSKKKDEADHNATRVRHSRQR